MTRSVRVSALQLRAHDRSDFTRVRDEIVAAVREASNGAELVVLPEGTFPAYVLGNANRDDDGSVTAGLDMLSRLAHDTSTVIVVGAAMRVRGALRNAALVIDRDGSLAGRADKLFLWHFDRRWFEAGDAVAPVDTSVGKLGVLICADGRLPTIARTLVDRGAELLVMPTAWVTSGRNPSVLENVQADLLARVRSYENGVPFVAANKCGAELGMVAYCGKSQIVNADGTIAAIASQSDPEILKAVVVTGAASPARTALAQPAPRATTVERPVRIAISDEPLPRDIDAKLQTLDDEFALDPDNDDRFAALDRVLPIARASDAEVLDPGGLVAYRRSGYRVAAWVTRAASPWTEAIARARAIELRMFVLVFDRAAGRAYCVDPDGTIVAGTFDGYRLASFALDPRRGAETTVAPGTDIFEGLERIAAIAHREGAAAP
jgi:predicted amidohydrolase